MSVTMSHRNWTEAETKWLFLAAGKIPDEWIGLPIGRTRDEVFRHRKAWGLPGLHVGHPTIKEAHRVRRIFGGTLHEGKQLVD